MPSYNPRLDATGKGARFQLFGDTMTTARLIQNHSKGNRVLLSSASAELLIHANKRKWIMEREDQIKTIEKGIMKTYWLVKGLRREYDIHDRTSCHSVEGSHAEDDGEFAHLDTQERWIEFNVETFKSLLKQIIAKRESGLNQLAWNASQMDVTAVSGTNKADMPLEGTSYGVKALQTWESFWRESPHHNCILPVRRGQRGH